MMISALTVSQQGDKYLGMSYSKMDCQAFVERCLSDAGLKRNLAGSNAWYREVHRNGWGGTPEDCKKRFGTIPKGAFLFILSEDGGEVQRGYRDGLGNASHIGLYTGRGKGALHSSSSRGMVCESAFNGKSIPNGGWNRVGLWRELDYGGWVNTLLTVSAGISKLTQPVATQTSLSTSAAETSEQAVTDVQCAETALHGSAHVSSANGKPVRVRAKPSTGSSALTSLPSGTAVEVLDTSGDWCRIAFTQTGWMMKRFLSGEPNQAQEG